MDHQLEIVIPKTPILFRYQRLRKATGGHVTVSTTRGTFWSTPSSSLRSSQQASAISRHMRMPITTSTTPRTGKAMKRPQGSSVMPSPDGFGTMVPTRARRQFRPRTSMEDPGARLIDVDASALGLEYVGSEVLLQQTRSPAHWDDGSRNVGGTSRTCCAPLKGCLDPDRRRVKGRGRYGQLLCASTSAHVCRSFDLQSIQTPAELKDAVEGSIPGRYGLAEARHLHPLRRVGKGELPGGVD